MKSFDEMWDTLIVALWRKGVLALNMPAILTKDDVDLWERRRNYSQLTDEERQIVIAEFHAAIWWQMYDYYQRHKGQRVKRIK